ncbi:MAG: hypothetical protein M9904_09940 [Chitinophagaceae bacterium]|nr:hypothetical protein [Chitinophagaceae bacterium]
MILSFQNCFYTVKKCITNSIIRGKNRYGYNFRFFVSVKYSFLSVCLLCFLNAEATELYIGKATADITPRLPVALMGQFGLRIAYKAETPLTANVIVLETRTGGRSLETTIMVSCDLVGVPNDYMQMVRAEVQKQLPGLNVNHIIFNATHTHTAPVLEDDPEKVSFQYKIPKEGVSQVSEYLSLFTLRVTDAIVKAWKGRSAGSIAWGQNRAAIAYNRRAVYADGTAVMYGKTDTPGFMNLEGYEDHDVNMLFFLDSNKRLIALGINVACPAQEVEGRSAVNADYWHEVRKTLQKKYGTDLCVLGWIGAAGDQSPHLMYRKKAEERMRKLSNINRMEDIAQRIAWAVDKTYEAVQNDTHTAIQLVHKVEKLSLPMRIITEEEYQNSIQVRDDAALQISRDPKLADQLYVKMTWYDDVVKRYERQKADPHPLYTTDIHVVRIGDVVICTNQFELFTDYGIRMQARSKALQTFVIQLAGAGTYLPTSKAVAGGGYSAICQSNVVGPEGGQQLVERTVALIDELWTQTK